ncbi:hypothetical protein E2320_013315, partial [Naja naja]
MPRAGSGKRFRLEQPAGRKQPDSAWSSDWDLRESNHSSPTMSLSECYIAVKLADQPLAPKSILRLPESELGECPLGGCSISYLKQLITGKLQESIPDPEFIEPVDKMAAVREFRVLHTALHSSPVFRDSDKDLFSVFADPAMLDTLIPSHPALVNAIVLVLHSVAGSAPLPTAETSSRSSMPSSSYRDMPEHEDHAVQQHLWIPASVSWLHRRRGASAHHAERVGHGSCPGQHPREQLTHPNAWNAGPFLRTSPMSPSCSQEHPSPMTSSARPYSTPSRHQDSLVF